MKRDRPFLFALAAYNEELALPGLLKRIRQVMEESGANYHVVVVDDGSLDATSDIARLWARQLPLTLRTHSVNRGLGMALRTGLKEACRIAAPETLIVTMDADMTHDPVAAIMMAERIHADDCDVVVASRYGPRGGEIGVSLMRRVYSRCLCFLMQSLFPIPGVHDYSSSFRLYRVETLETGFESWGEAFISERGFVCMAEVLLKLRRTGAHIGEISFPLRYDRKQGASKLKVVHTIWRYFVLMAGEIVRTGADFKPGRPEAASSSSAASVSAKRQVRRA